MDQGNVEEPRLQQSLKHKKFKTTSQEERGETAKIKQYQICFTFPWIFFFFFFLMGQPHRIRQQLCLMGRRADEGQSLTQTGLHAKTEQPSQLLQSQGTASHRGCKIFLPFVVVVETPAYQNLSVKITKGTFKCSPSVGRETKIPFSLVVGRGSSVSAEGRNKGRLKLLERCQCPS